MAFTARGCARVVQEPMIGAPAFTAVAIDVEDIDDHRQRELVIELGVSLDWRNERTQRFLATTLQHWADDSPESLIVQLTTARKQQTMKLFVTGLTGYIRRVEYAIPGWPDG